MFKPCIQCGDISQSTRCTECQRDYEAVRGSGSSRGYGSAWTKLSKRARLAQPFCLWCGTTEDLTTDHIVALANGGKRTGLTLADVQILCRPCNSKKAATENPIRRT